MIDSHFKTIFPCVIAAILFSCHASPATAQEHSFKFEITPFVAYRIGGNFDQQDGDGEFELDESNAQGIMLNIRANPNGQFEVLYARQSTEVDTQDFFVNDSAVDIDVEYFHLGGTYLFDGENVRPFVALTIGLSHFDPRIATLDSESFFSASFGAGIHFNASRRIGLRLEARVFTTLVESDSNIFCVSAGEVGECLIHVDGTMLSQFEARAGLVFRF